MGKIENKSLILISLVLFLIPFFWLQIGDLALGGDSHRLFFYDPLSNLISQSLYTIHPWGTGAVGSSQSFLVYLLFLSFLKQILSSSTLLIDTFNGIKLSVSFFFVALIIKEFIQKKDYEKETTYVQFGAILGGLFYAFSSSVLDNMKYALISHDLVFLNPMLFYFSLRYLKTNLLKYMCLVLLISFIFSSSFVLLAPPVFAFYPLIMIFLILYNRYVLYKPFPIKGVIIFLVFFIGLHAFHLIPLIFNLLDTRSELQLRAIESFSNTNVGLEYFNATVQSSKLSTNILMPLESQKFSWSLIIIPFLTILGFISNKKKERVIYLLSIFFFITLFLKTANITNLGLEIYRKFFELPGFGMFRNFSGQWQFVYTFFYSVLFGVLISIFFSRLKKRYIIIIFATTILFLVGRSQDVLDGSLINTIQRGTKDTRVIIRMDPEYEKLLNYIQKIPNDGRFFQLPFTDFSYNVVGGVNNGVYVGPSMVSFLAGKSDFSGYHDINPYSETFRKLVKEKNYPSIRQMLSLLQVRYIIYNSDEKVSDKNFSTFPYGYTGIPVSPPAVLNFVQNISSKKIYESGYYSIYEVENNNYLPHFYFPKTILLYNNTPKYGNQYNKALAFFPPNPEIDSKDTRIAFLNRKDCVKIFSSEQCGKKIITQDIENVSMIYQRINPTKYKVSIKHDKPILIVFQTAYGQDWKLYANTSSVSAAKPIDSYFGGQIKEGMPSNYKIDLKPFETNGKKSFFETSHVEVNGYANAWYIKPNENSNNTYEFIVEKTAQKIFYYSFIISLISLLFFILFFITIFNRRYE